MTTDTAAPKETRGFQSEVNQLLDLVINSLYSHREIFLRELISNASDAIDKLKFLALTNEGLYESDPDPFIDIEYDTVARTITVRDNGIGMSREEVVDHLGTIARSGTKEFFGKLSGDARQDSQLIGQFGVGFYAAFIVADRVTVNSRRAGLAPAAGVCWQSDGKGEYTVETITQPARGTEVILHLKEEALEFANGWRLRDLVKRYSDHISTPIRMNKEGKDETGTETVNHATALWTRGKQELSEDDYKQFYRHVAHDFEDPLAWVHTKSEGKLEYTTLFYVPGRAPFDLFDRDSKQGVKLYVQRVFIMEDTEQLLPRFLRFIRGVVDTRDLPLNVSRELLQRNKAIDTIRGASIKKVLGMIEDLAAGENYGRFWQAFGRVLKEGVVEDHANRERVAKLLRFASTRFDQPEQSVSLEDYKSRMVADQQAIYYLTAENYLTAKNSPHLEVFRDKGVEVLLLTDPIDEWLVSHFTEFDGKPLKSVLHGKLELPGTSEDGEETPAEGEHAALVARIKGALGEKVKDVWPSHRLTHSPACLVSEDHEMSANLARILKASGQEVPATTRILEINAGHPLLTYLADETDEDRFKEWTSILFEQAVLAEGGRLDDPAGFVHRINELVLDLAKAARPS